ncbi:MULTISPECIES: thioesterase II family protein [Serratia]|uniref:thioesterase II family protein n=1 Tax=Serratia TaxID=613 RepID=UPI001AEAA5A1|nr:MULTISPECIES: alpha/beta fold hydrolase [Serratia]MBP1132514.1 surfactin synthase thioesterase subunit [Serratia sp. PL17]
MKTQFIRECHYSPENRHNLICFPHAGGGTGRYHRWGSEVGKYANVYAPVIAGREERFPERAMNSVESVIDDIYARIRPASAEKLYVCGVSYGALLAYELANRFEKQGIVVDGVFIASQRAPYVCKEIIDWENISNKALVDALTSLSDRSNAGFTDDEYFSIFADTIRRDLCASDNFQPAQPRILNAPIYISYGNLDPVIPRNYIDSWATMSHASINVTEHNAGHFLMDENLDIWLSDVAKVVCANHS